MPSSKYLLAAGQAISRTTYATLLAADTITESVIATNGSPTLTEFSDTTQIGSGAVIEASFLSAPTTITSCTSTTCTMAANASASTTANATIFPYGDGCGAKTPCSSIGTNFNLPDCRGVTFAGRDNMNGTVRGMLTSTYYGTNPDALGVFGGAQKFALGATNLPSITSSNSGIGVSVTLGPPSAVAVCNIHNGSCATNNGSGVNVQTNSDVNLAPASLNNALASVSGVTVTQGTSHLPATTRPSRRSSRRSARTAWFAC